MTRERDVDLDDFWLGHVELANLAAHVLTERDDGDDSIWSGDPYGSLVGALFERPGTEELIRRELERVVSATDTDATIESISPAGATVRALDVRIAITRDAVSTEE